MRFTFTFYDIQEISSTAYSAFISTFNYLSDESESDKSDSDLSDFDQDTFGCSEITQEVENFVDNNWEVCNPLEAVYGTSTSEIIQETISSATEETQCVGLNFFKHMNSDDDKSLIDTCTAICYWCCCNGIKKVSPIIAEATTNLIY